MRDLHRRRSLRLPGYDYGSAGAYFVTVCAAVGANGHAPRPFGEVIGGEMRLSDAGRIVADEWRLSATLRVELVLDEWIVMPDHVHGIVIIDHGRCELSPTRETVSASSSVVGASSSVVGASSSVVGASSSVVGAYGHTPLRSPSKTIGAMIRGFKSSATKRINALRGTPGVPVWQRNYYEHIVRDEDSLDRIRRYITENPAHWTDDPENTYRRRRPS
jgi:putative transposase